MRLIFSLLFCFTTFFAHAEKKKNGDKVIVISENERHQGDFFAFGKDVEIAGTVTGDLYVFGGRVFVDGTVEGSVILAGGTCEISGTVGSSVRALCGQIRVSGTVQKNVSIVAGNFELTRLGLIRGDVVSLTGNTDLSGTVGFDATVVSSNLRVAGNIKNDLKAYAQDVRITSHGRIDGTLTYRSGSPAWIDPQAKVIGKITYQPTIVGDLLKGTWLHGVLLGSQLAALFMNFVFTFVIGLIVLKLFPASIHSAVAVLKNHPAKALIYGVVLLILFPIAALLLLMTILGAPFALTIFALNVVTFYTVKIISIMWVGNYLLPKIGLKTWKVPTFALALVVYFVLTLVPYFGQIMAFAALLFGLGSVVLTQGKHLHLPAKH